MGDLPHIRRTGAYLFFAICAFGVSLLGYAAAGFLGFNHDLKSYAGSVALVATFFALRDMTTIREAAQSGGEGESQ